MTYATQADLETAFGVAEILQLTDRDQNGSVDAAFMAAALARADAVIDSYLGGHYTVPITPTPTVVLGIAVDLARYFLYDDAVPERVRIAYEDAINWLKDVARGGATLGLPPETTPASITSGLLMTSDSRRFDADTF